MSGKAPLKTLYILSSEFPPGPGGIGTHAYQLACQLQNRSWSVAVFAPQDYARQETIVEFNKRQPFSIIQFPTTSSIAYKYGIRAFLVLWHIINKRPKLILATGMKAVWLGWMSSLLFRVPLAVIGHGTEFQDGSPLKNWLTRRAFDRATVVIAVSKFTSSLIYQCGIRPSSLEVIPNAADPDLYQPGMENNALCWKYKLFRPIVLTVGHLSKRKAQDVVIKALPHVVEHFPTLGYIMVGQPTLQDELRDLADSLNVGKHVMFAGMVSAEELPLYYNLCDVFVLVSRRTDDGDVEGYGIAAIEAALCGKPTIGTRGCGLQEAVIEGETGLLVDMDDPLQTSHAILKLLGDQQLRMAMGQRALERAKKEYTWEATGAVYHGLLSNLVEVPRS